MTRCFQYNDEERQESITICQAISLLLSPFPYWARPLSIFYSEMGLPKLPRLASNLSLESREAFDHATSYLSLLDSCDCSPIPLSMTACSVLFKNTVCAWIPRSKNKYLFHTENESMQKIKHMSLTWTRLSSSLQSHYVDIIHIVLSVSLVTLSLCTIYKLRSANAAWDQVRERT